MVNSQSWSYVKYQQDLIQLVAPFLSNTVFTCRLDFTLLFVVLVLFLLLLCQRSLLPGMCCILCILRPPTLLCPRAQSSDVLFIYMHFPCNPLWSHGFKYTLFITLKFISSA